LVLGCSRPSINRAHKHFAPGQYLIQSHGQTSELKFCLLYFGRFFFTFGLKVEGKFSVFVSYFGCGIFLIFQVSKDSFLYVHMCVHLYVHIVRM
jgi:hypothetical protein